MPISAIIVPASRPSSHLGSAVKLAQESGCFLLVLCSKKASAQAAQEFIHSAGISDLSLKRNLGVLIARLAGWQKIFFLDDDIGSLSAGALHKAAASLDQHDLAGFIAGEFPDNSVIRHAERLSGTEPGRHLSGSALAINVAQAKGFFPDIYNEDWLFMYDNEDNAVEVGYVAQQPYDPFRSPRRAVSEEFGDVIAEGLLQLNTGGLAATESDWEAVLHRRRLLLTDIRSRLIAQPTAVAQESALRSLEAAEVRLLELDPASCVRYIKSWRRDLSLWHQRHGAQPSNTVVKLLMREKVELPAWVKLKTKTAKAVEAPAEEAAAPKAEAPADTEVTEAEAEAAADAVEEAPAEVTEEVRVAEVNEEAASDAEAKTTDIDHTDTEADNK
jgi:hypothetical protein